MKQKTVENQKLQYLRSLCDDRWLQEQEVGIHAFYLSQLARAGFPVIEGTVITINAWKEHIANVLLADQHKFGRAITLLSDLPKKLKEELLHLVKTVENQPLMVSSSPATIDEKNSLVQQYCLPEHHQLEIAIRKCWANAYRNSEGQCRIIPVAVLVQPLLETEATGIYVEPKGSLEGVTNETNLVQTDLSKEQFNQVSQLYREIEGYLNIPVQIRWVFNGSKLSVLQVVPGEKIFNTSASAI